MSIHSGGAHILSSSYKARELNILMKEDGLSNSADIKSNKTTENTY